MLYNIGAYQSAKEEYETLYPELKNRGAFLFEYGYCLHKLKQYDSSTVVLEEAMKHSCDPVSYTHLDVYKRQILSKEVLFM